jgi:hypothetical protein
MDTGDAWTQLAEKWRDVPTAEVVSRIDAAWDAFDRLGRGMLPAGTVLRVVDMITQRAIPHTEGTAYFAAAGESAGERGLVARDAFRTAFLRRVKPNRGDRLNRLLVHPTLGHTRETSYKLPPLDTRFGTHSDRDALGVGGTLRGEWAEHKEEEDWGGPAPLLVRAGGRLRNVRGMTHGKPPRAIPDQIGDIVGNKWGGREGGLEPVYPHGSELERKAVRVGVAAREGRVGGTGFLNTRTVGGGHDRIDPSTVVRLDLAVAPPPPRQTRTSTLIAQVGRSKADLMERGEVVHWFRPQTAGYWKLGRFEHSAHRKIDTWVDREPPAFQALRTRHLELEATRRTLQATASSPAPSRRPASAPAHRK